MKNQPEWTFSGSIKKIGGYYEAKINYHGHFECSFLLLFFFQKHTSGKSKTSFFGKIEMSLSILSLLCLLLGMIIGYIISKIVEHKASNK